MSNYITDNLKKRVGIWVKVPSLSHALMRLFDSDRPYLINSISNVKQNERSKEARL